MRFYWGTRPIQSKGGLLDACLRIVDVRGIMGRACAKQWGAHVQSNGLRMCKAMACAWRWLYLLANTSAPLKDQSLMLSLSCMDMVSPDKLSRLLLSMKPVQLNNLSASVLVAKTQRYFLASLHRLGNWKRHTLFNPNHVLATTGKSCSKKKGPFAQIIKGGNVILGDFLG